MVNIQVKSKFDKDPIKATDIIISAMGKGNSRYRKGIEKASYALIDDMKSVMALWETFPQWSSTRTKDSVYHSWSNIVVEKSPKKYKRVVKNISLHVLALENGVRPHIVPLTIDSGKLLEWAERVLPPDLLERAKVLGYIAVGGRNSRIRAGVSQRKFLQKGLDKFMQRKYEKQVNKSLQRFFDNLKI